MTRREYKANPAGSAFAEPLNQRAERLVERSVVGEDAELGRDSFAFGLARNSDRKRSGPERIVDADSMGAQPQMKAVVERRRQHVVTQI